MEYFFFCYNNKNNIVIAVLRPDSLSSEVCAPGCDCQSMDLNGMSILKTFNKRDMKNYIRILDFN